MARSRKNRESHVRLYRHEHRSEAYQSLSPEGRALLIEFRALYTGKDNSVHMSVRQMMKRLNISQRPAERARDQLLDRGFIRMRAKGSFSRKAKHASEYVLTSEPVNGKPPTKDFMKWRQQKNTVAESTTDGSGRRYRERSKKPENGYVGSGIDYREGPKQTIHGSGIDYTGKLPPSGAVKTNAEKDDKGDWLKRYMGWPSKRGLLLNTCCIKCGVWVTDNFREFDERWHSCDPVSKAKYEQQFEPECPSETPEYSQ